MRLPDLDQGHLQRDRRDTLRRYRPEGVATFNRHCLEFVANLQLAHLAVKILDRSGSRIFFIDFVDSPDNGEHYIDEGMVDGCQRRDNNLPSILYSVRRFRRQISDTGYNACPNDEDEADAVERVLVPAENYPFEIELLLADSGFYNERDIHRALEWEMQYGLARVLTTLIQKTDSQL